MRVFAYLVLLVFVGCQQQPSERTGAQKAPPDKPDVGAAQVAAPGASPKEGVATQPAPVPVAAPAQVAGEAVPGSYPYVGAMTLPTDVPCQSELPLPPPPLVYFDPMYQILGPDRPLLADLEEIPRKAVAQGWFDAPVKPYVGANSRTMSSLEAMLNPESLANAISAVIYASTHSQIDLIMANQALIENDLFDFFLVLGVPLHRDMKSDMYAKLRAQAVRLGSIYEEFMELVARKDKFFGTLRVSLASFRYRDKQGNEGLGCMAFLNAGGAWRLLDLTCQLPDMIKVPTDVPGRSILDLSVEELSAAKAVPLPKIQPDVPGRGDPIPGVPSPQSVAPPPLPNPPAPEPPVAPEPPAPAPLP